MAALGTINGKLHISIGEGVIAEVATFAIPLVADAPPQFGPTLSIRVDSSQMCRNVAEALRAVAEYLEEEGK